MKKRRYVGIVLVVVSVALLMGAYMLNANRKMRFVQQLGAGYNMGNSLEAYGLREYEPEATDLDYEVYWGNPTITQEQFATIRKAGFRSVRIPVTWYEHMDASGKVSEVWMNRVAEVVDMALAEDLYVILNSHHESWMNLELEREAEITEQLSSLWSQIATRFMEYDEHLLFEGMNEPRLQDSEVEWTAGTDELRGMVNRLNQTFVDSVRAVGGANHDRYLLIGAYVTGTETEALEALEIPSGNIIVSAHIYRPYSFCQKEDGTTEWSADVMEDTKEIEAAFSDFERLFLKNRVPVVITEFGSKNKANTEERVEWASYFCGRAKEVGVPYFWWDNGSDYQILERETGEWWFPELVEVLVQSWE